MLSFTEPRERWFRVQGFTMDSLTVSCLAVLSLGVFCLSFWNFPFRDMVSFHSAAWCRTQHVAQAGLRLTVILLPPPPVCSDYRYVLVCLAVLVIFQSYLMTFW